jgi:thymidylate synthase
MNINDKIIQAINILYYSGKTIRDSRWQSVETSLYMYEVNNLFFKAPMPEEVNSLAFQCQPDLPWSEDHFQERVGGKPLNPGNEYKNWPYYKAEIDDKRFREKGEDLKFSHSYMERYWPPPGLKGIRYNYGNLLDVVDRLNDNPLTRQAYFSVWHPEDQKDRKERVPCTLGYHFLIREDKLNITYHIRSCDIRRHFKNDIYMTVRLAQWIRAKLNIYFKMGDLNMWIGSLHCFDNEIEMLKQDMKKWKN